MVRPIPRFLTIPVSRRYADHFDRLANELAKTVNKVTRANRKTIEKLVELLRHGEVIEYRIAGFRQVQPIRTRHLGPRIPDLTHGQTSASRMRPQQPLAKTSK